MRKRLGEILVESGLITTEQLNHALKVKSIRKQGKQRLGETLVELGFATDNDIANALSEKLNIPFINCADHAISDELKELVPKNLAEERLVFPLEKKDNILILAMIDPLDYRTIDEISFKTKLKISSVVSYRRSIFKAIEKNYSEDKSFASGIEFPYNDAMVDTLNGIVTDPLNADTSVKGKNIQVLEEKQIDDIDDNINIEALQSKSNAPIVVKLVASIIEDAVKMQASDIHIEPREKYVQVRFRIDGELRNMFRYVRNIHGSVVSRIKITSKLDITNKRTPQDGRALASFKDKETDIRVSTLPSICGEKVVMRLLNRSDGIVPLEDLRMPDHVRNPITKLLKQPQGMFIVTGPTGSGKTTTLYACLNYLHSETRNIVTAEDPVEYKLEGITQVSVNEAIGLTFASALRSFLRQDPDVILVGEIRDIETAEIAIKAALTGHFVLATLHTNNTVATITRLIDIGLSPYLLGPAISGILAQRLIRRACDGCKVKLELPDKLYSISGLPDLTKCYYGTGCPKCSNTGYSGRIAVYEYLSMTPSLRRLISKNAGEEELLMAAKKEGTTFLFEDAWHKVAAGLTTIDEVIAKVPMEYRVKN